jgi:hypothetical protein
LNQDEFYACFPQSRQTVREAIAIIGSAALKHLTLFLMQNENDQSKIPRSDNEYVKDMCRIAVEIMVEEMKKDLEFVDKEQDKFVEKLGI